MKKASFLRAFMLVSAVAMGEQTNDPAAMQITVTPQNAQKVIVGTPNHFTGSARVQSLFDAKPPSHNTGAIVTHWHGASPKSSVTHIAVQEELNGTNVVWLEPVADAQYNPKQQ